MSRSIAPKRAGAVLVILQILLLAACAARTESSGRLRSGQLSRADMSGYSTVHDAVRAMRSGWLQARTPVLLTPSRTVVSEHISGAVPVWVYRDGTRMGGPDMLRQIPVAEVASVEFVEPRAATNRWGMNHENGVILVMSRKSAE